VSTPYDSTATPIAVTVYTREPPPQGDDVAVIRMVPPVHDHPAGVECVACAAAGDIRARLFDLLASVRTGGRPPFASVAIDARDLSDPQPVIDRLSPTSPAVGLRDFTVMRSFRLAGVV
jgi:hypothetical protein